MVLVAQGLELCLGSSFLGHEVKQLLGIDYTYPCLSRNNEGQQGHCNHQ